MTIALIRHGQTPGNAQGRYIGSRMDEGLSEAGRAALTGRSAPKARRVFVSPMRRALETARLLYPLLEPEIVADFRECDFGEFEGKNYAELNGRSDYQAWIDSGGQLRFPGGESREEFVERCVRAWDALRPTLKEDCALIAHGGTIMAIMAHCARPQGDYYDFQVKNGEGFLLNEDGTYRKLTLL